MMSLINLHTHQAIHLEGTTGIVNLELGEECPKEGLYSYGIHPWNTDDENFSLETALICLEERLQLPQVVALGEAGLDKMHALSFERQLQVFERQIELSERYKKPLIIHDVKCHNEIIALRKKFRAQQTWIIHGFNGTEQDIQQLTGQDIYLSVGEAILHPEKKITRALKGIQVEYLFLETDTADIRIEAIYEEAAKILEMEENELRDQIFTNFARIFYDHGRLAR